MSEVKRPLEGVKVLELATFIAAPCCARFLADLGAEVIKVEAPAGDPLRYTAVNEGRPQDQKENTSYDLENAGKTCVCLNADVFCDVDDSHRLCVLFKRAIF